MNDVMMESKVCKYCNQEITYLIEYSELDESSIVQYYHKICFDLFVKNRGDKG